MVKTTSSVTVRARSQEWVRRREGDTQGKEMLRGVLASFDGRLSGANDLALVRKARDDMRQLVRASGAVVAETKDVICVLSQDLRFSLHVHVACDFGEHSYVLAPRSVGWEILCRRDKVASALSKHGGDEGSEHGVRSQNACFRGCARQHLTTSQIP